MFRHACLKPCRRCSQKKNSWHFRQQEQVCRGIKDCFESSKNWFVVIAFYLKHAHIFVHFTQKKKQMFKKGDTFEVFYMHSFCLVLSWIYVHSSGICQWSCIRSIKKLRLFFRNIYQLGVCMECSDTSLSVSPRSAPRSRHNLARKRLFHI